MALFDFLTGGSKPQPIQAPTISPEGFEQPNIPIGTKPVIPSSNQGLELFQITPTEDAQTRMQQFDNNTSSFMPKFLATMAALSGNFGPALQLQEQQRKTNLAKATFPDIIKINALTNEGKFDEAQQLAEAVGNAAVSRTPELAPLYTGIANRIADKQNKVTQVKNTTAFYEAHNDMYKASHNGEDSPLLAPLVKYLKDASKRNQPVDPGLMQSMMQKAEPHIQNVEGQTLSTNPLSGVTTSSVIPQVTKASQFESITGNAIGAAYGLTPTQLSNLHNNQAVMSTKSGLITPDSPTAQAVKKDVTDLQLYESNALAAKLVPLDPTQVLALLHSGTPVDAIVQRQLNRGNISAGYEDFFERRIREQEAPILAQIRKDPMFLQKNNAVAIVTDPRSANFGQEVDPQTWEMLERQGLGSSVKVRNRDMYTKQIAPSINTIQGLGYILDIFQQGDDDKSLMDSLSYDLKRFLSNKFGFPIGEGMTKVTAAETIVKNAIEEASQSGALPREEIGRLKAQMTKPFTSPEQAMEAAMYLQNRIKQSLSRNIGEESVKGANIPGEIKQPPSWMRNIPKAGSEKNQQPFTPGLIPGSGR